ncbi:peptidyl-prolyl cis-trans isomerase [Paraconexibacter antarcticus]|uniref:peptidylprolyl isomerase n=1 Tax=Paraconexibacter antarcticus TaxID=2949664 RepID=A0ABY5DY04_9ACTN|nr:peptidyl-prolyl cis-trans isomerase [Paraconexibacter antarcticus]UTI66031.1 peptidyl-prolyl cis-trans isomerase [Paraconexibacter antarcticus]
MNALLDGADRVYWWLRQRPPVAAAIAVAIAALIVVLAVTGGDSSTKKGIPASAVATVGGAPIQKTDLAHWQAVYVKSSTGATTKPTTAQARQAAFELLAGSEWITKEAERQGVKVTDAEAKKAADTYLKSAATQAKVSQAQVLQQLGTGYADVQFQQRVALLAQRLQQKVVKALPAPTAAAIQRAYTTEPGRWATPSTRDVEAIIASSKANAAAALAAVQGGTAFATVSQKYETSQALAQTGGKITGLKPGTTDAAVERPVFSAPVGSWQGPVPVGGGGYLVFKVDKSVPAPKQTLQQATPAIKANLSAVAASTATTNFLAGLSKRWKPQTHCATGIVSPQYCGPKA